MASIGNQWLGVRDSVVLTEISGPVVKALDSYFGQYSLRSTVTSGKRSPEHQVEIIKGFAIQKAVDTEFPAILSATLNGKITLAPGDEVYEWQPAWSRLLTMGIMISPPISVACMFDYEHPAKGHIAAGTVRPASEHFCTGPIHPFDIGGTVLPFQKRAIDDAIEAGMPGLIDYLLERENNCLHIRCQAV